MFSFILALLITTLNIRIIYKIYQDFKILEKERKNWFVDQSSDSEYETSYELEHESNIKYYSKNKNNNNNNNTNTNNNTNNNTNTNNSIGKYISARLSNIDETIEEIKSFAEHTHETLYDILIKVESLNNELIKTRNENKKLKQRISNVDEFTKNINKHYEAKFIKETYPVLYKIISTSLKNNIIKPTTELTNKFNKYSPEFNTIIFEMYLYSEYDYVGPDSSVDYKDKYDIIFNNLDSLSCDEYYNSINLNNLSAECKDFYYTYSNLN